MCKHLNTLVKKKLHISMILRWRMSNGLSNNIIFFGKQY